MSTIQKIYWSEIKQWIKDVSPCFYEIVDEISPGYKFPIYLLKFPYGKLIGDQISQFIPIDKKQLLRLTDPSIPKEIRDDLGYGAFNSPLGMLLDKYLEWYVDLPHKSLTLPTTIQKPGTFFSYSKVLDLQSPYNYSPMGLLNLISGARSIFMLPSIGCNTKLTRLNRSLGTKCKQPKSLYNHFDIFQKILLSDKYSNNWYSSILYFSEPWVTNIKYNPEWFDLQKYFYKIYAHSGMFLKNLPHYNISISLLLEKMNQKPNPYLLDTFKHILTIAAGEMPGFAPQAEDTLAPTKQLQELFVQYYSLGEHYPTIIAPTVFNVNSKQPKPVYYSLQYPTTSTFTPKSKKSSTMADMRTLFETSTELLNELSKDNNFCSNTIIQYIANNMSINYLHNSDDIDGVINKIDRVFIRDNSFNSGLFKNAVNTKIAFDGKFFRGCVQISKK